MMNRQPLTPHDALYNVSAKFSLPATLLATISGSTYFTTAVPLIPAAVSIGIPRVYLNHHMAPVVDATAAAEGVKLKRGIWRFDMTVRFGDATGGAGAVGNAAFCVFKKGATANAGVVLFSPSFSTAAVASSTTASEDAASGTWTESGFFEITDDDTTMQICGRKTAGTSVSLKSGSLVITRVANNGAQA